MPSVGPPGEELESRTNVVVWGWEGFRSCSWGRRLFIFLRKSELGMGSMTGLGGAAEGRAWEGSKTVTKWGLTAAVAEEEESSVKEDLGRLDWEEELGFLEEKEKESFSSLPIESRNIDRFRRGGRERERDDESSKTTKNITDASTLFLRLFSHKSIEISYKFPTKHYFHIVTHNS